MWGPKKARRKARGTKVAWTNGSPPPKPPRKRDRALVWKDKVVEARATAPRATPANYQFPPEVSEALESAIQNGRALVAKYDMALGDLGVYPFPTLDRLWRFPNAADIAAVSKGSLLMYAGAVRSTERKWLSEGNHADVQVVKHTFITPRGRCIIHDFSLIDPA